jgi:hypothetical protein
MGFLEDQLMLEMFYLFSKAFELFFIGFWLDGFGKLLGMRKVFRNLDYDFNWFLDDDLFDDLGRDFIFGGEYLLIFA